MASFQPIRKRERHRGMNCIHSVCGIVSFERLERLGLFAGTWRSVSNATSFCESVKEPIAFASIWAVGMHVGF